jgi:hypothetical protein
VRDLLSSHIPKSRCAKPRRVEYQDLAWVSVNLVRWLGPFRVSVLGKIRGQGNTCIIISRIVKARSTSLVRPVVIADDHMGMDKGW